MNSLAHASQAAPEPSPEAGKKPSNLPAFVTPEWLRANHHLMKADLRKLAASLSEEYASWPASANGSEELTFWQAVHDLSRQWTWFLVVFEERILKLFSVNKGRKKQLVHQVLKSASTRARIVRDSDYHIVEPTFLDDLDTLSEAGEWEPVAEVVWALTCFEGRESAEIVEPWLDEPVIEDLVLGSIERLTMVPNAEIADLEERLREETEGPHLDLLIGRAEEYCNQNQGRINEKYLQLRNMIRNNDEYRGIASELGLHHDRLRNAESQLSRIERLGNVARARNRLFALRQMLVAIVDAMVESRFADDQGGIRERVEALPFAGPNPNDFPESGWTLCLEQVQRFRAALLELPAQELVLRDASRLYAEHPTPENLEALQCAAQAQRDQGHSTVPAIEALQAIADCLESLDRQQPDSEWTSNDLFAALSQLVSRTPDKRDPANPVSRMPEHTEAAIADLRKRNDALSQTLDDIREENVQLRSENHRVRQKLARLSHSATSIDGLARSATVPALETYAELPAWVSEHFDGRVALAGRALRAIKNAGFEDVALVGKAIELLATTYRRMKIAGGKEMRETFETELRALRLLETPSLSRDQQGKSRDDFFVEWNGRKLNLDRHLKNNAKTYDPKYCFRLYFSWDAANELVVIGHLPGHMRI